MDVNVETGGPEPVGENEVELKWTKEDLRTLRMLRRKVGEAQAKSVMDRNPDFAPQGALFAGQGTNKLILVGILTGAIMVVSAEGMTSGAPRDGEAWFTVDGRDWTEDEAKGILTNLTKQAYPDG